MADKEKAEKAEKPKKEGKALGGGEKK